MTVPSTLLGKAAAILATAVVAGGVALALTGSATAVAEAGPARAWIDDPLDGSRFAPGPVAIVAHAYHPDGIGEMSLVVDGIVLETMVPDGAGGVLASAIWAWTPVSEGVHVLEVVGRDAAGGAGLPGRAVVEIRVAVPPSDPAPPPTQATTTTSTSTSTTSTTTSSSTTSTSSTTTSTTTTAPPPCTPAAPLLISPEDGHPFMNPPSITFEWVSLFLFQGVCLPSGYLAEVSFDADFTEIVVSADLPGGTTEWTPDPATWRCTTTYHWRVWSRRSDGTLTAEPSSYQFRIECVA